MKDDRSIKGAVAEERKTFEIRKNDRDFKIDDYLLLKEFEETYTGWVALVKVIYMTDYEQKNDYVVLGIKLDEQFGIRECT
ncbi:TPA_asm: RNA-binding protein [Listeria monocytogenes]|nr:RNA-binding protein [Listeria monocytogenes]HAB0672653.1 RNA-binding protein [Listeria monocytogenes]